MSVLRKTVLGAFWVVLTHDLALCCVDSGRSPGQPVGYDAVQLIPSNLSAGQQSILSSAMSMWNSSSCNPGGSAFPRFQTQPAGAGRSVTVTFVSGSSSDRPERCAIFAGNNITLYEFAQLPSGQVVPCSRSDVLEDTIAHELGHLLGLIDQFDSACSTHIMGQAGFTSGGSYVNRTVKPGECSKVAQTNETPAEQVQDDCLWSPDCDSEPTCPPHNPECSPIVLDLSGRGFEFTGLDDPVDFDIDADQAAESIGWTGRRRDLAFLCWDRNGNGRIDDGSELFGDSTPFLNGNPAQNGYQVLFELDVAYGDGDGWIAPADRIFDRLQVWTDGNHDGESQPWELASLAARGVAAIATEHYSALKRDPQGNWFRYFSEALLVDARGRLVPTTTVDVFFVVAPEP